MENPKIKVPWPNEMLVGLCETGNLARFQKQRRCFSIAGHNQQLARPISPTYCFDSEKSCQINSIAFGSALRREAEGPDSQRISQLVRPAVSQTVWRASRQADRNTQFGFFFSGRLGFKQLGEHLLQNAQWPSGKAADRQPAGRWFEPWSAGRGAGADVSQPAGNRTADLSGCGRLHYLCTAAYSDSTGSPHCLKPSEHKLLTPPPPPPLQKVIYSFRG